MVAEASQCPQPWPATPKLPGIQRPTLASSESSRPNAHLNSGSVQLKAYSLDHSVQCRRHKGQAIQTLLKSAEVE